MKMKILILLAIIFNNIVMAIPLSSLQKEVDSFNSSLKTKKQSLPMKLEKYTLNNKFFIYHYSYNMNQAISNVNSIKDIKIIKSVIFNLKSMARLELEKNICNIPLVQKEIITKGIKPKLEIKFILNNKEIDSLNEIIFCKKRD